MTYMTLQYITTIGFHLVGFFLFVKPVEWISKPINQSVI